MISYSNRISLRIPLQQLAEMALGPASRGQVQLLVEIAVIKPALPVDTDQGATHDLLEIAAAMLVLQEAPVGLQLSLGLEPASKTLDRHIGYGVEARKNHPKIGGKHAVVLRLQFGLGRGQGRALGVVDELQIEAAAWLAVAKGIELA